MKTIFCKFDLRSRHALACLLALLATLAVLSIPTAFGQSFTDVQKDHPNFAAIEYLDTKEVVDGYADGTFKPDNSVNRAEAAKIIVNAFKIILEEKYEAVFPDVLEQDWFFKFVLAGKKNGFIDGYEDKKFRPAETVNLAESLKMIIQAAKGKLPEKVEANVFVDVVKDVWYAKHALYARENNLLLSDDEGKIHGEKAMTRAEFAELVYRMMLVSESSGKPYRLDTNWQYYEGVKLPFKMKYDAQEWKLIEHNDEVIFYRPDQQFKQFSATRVYPKSAVVKITLDKNEEKLAQNSYFDNVKSAFFGATYKEFALGNLKALEVLNTGDLIVDWYIYLADGRVLVVYTQFGNGPIVNKLQTYARAMLATLEYKEIPAQDYTELLSKIFSMILVEGKGMEIIKMLPDRTIIETDTLGVGTGPIDYYYSSELDYTFKYERSADVVLDKRKTKTSLF